MQQRRRSSRSNDTGLLELAGIIRRGETVCCISGAGLSADSGIPTFRSTPNAVWNDRTIQYGRTDVFLRNPLSWYNEFWLKTFREDCFANAEPSPGHIAIAKLAQNNKNFYVITQNIDSLHRHPAACVPEEQYLAVHGTFGIYRCLAKTRAGTTCNFRSSETELVPWELDKESGKKYTQFSAPPRCGLCLSPAVPDALLFDEDYNPKIFQTAADWLSNSSAIAFVGTSNSVGITKHALDIAENLKVPVFNFNLSVHSLRSNLLTLPIHHVLGRTSITLPRLFALITKHEEN